MFLQEPEKEDSADSTCWKIMNFLHLSGKRRHLLEIQSILKCKIRKGTDWNLTPASQVEGMKLLIKEHSLTS